MYVTLTFDRNPINTSSHTLLCLFLFFGMTTSNERTFLVKETQNLVDLYCLLYGLMFIFRSSKCLSECPSESSGFTLTKD